MSKLTANQQKAVECAGRPLFIQAGAGTGKTFTLTKRLAYGLSDQSGPLLKSVDNVLTITFTNKAAAELLGRVRAELRAQGLADAALLIDGAWISTIHGMCNRILGAHALEAGIDPGMPLLSNEDAGSLLQQAVDEALGSDAMEELVSAFGPSSACALVGQLVSLVEMAPDGIESFELGPEVCSDPVKAMRALAESLDAHLASLEELGVREAPSAACSKQLDRLELAASTAGELAQHDDLTWDIVAQELEQCAPPKGGALKKAYREDFAVAFELVADARVMAASAQASGRLKIALELTCQTAERYRDAKRACGVQDTNDLLMNTYRLLKANPQIAENYRERFGSIMVDEFQDTDILQVGIINSFCDKQLSTLTTVGDAQQSIYGFRGADLETYRSVRKQMSDAGSLEVSLDVNYRSHPDILAFVESIFSKPSFFGQEFLHISAGPANVREYPWAPSGSSRVTMYLAAGQKSPNGRSSTAVSDLREAEAQFIASRFEELAAKGASYGQMAILMSSTKSAGPYLAALRERGIPCAVSGGSDFYLQPEVGVMTALVRVLELPDDDQPLLLLLASPMFDISDGDLLALRTIAKRELRNPALDDVRPKVSLFDALEYQAARLPQDGKDSLVRAYQILSEAYAQVGAAPLSLVLADVLERCGWFEELKIGGAAGLAKAANIERFIDLVAEFEQQSGPSAVSAGEHFRMLYDMAQEGAGAKGKPGRMVSLGNDSVQVMTIHASKGLEFPIVAVAQYARSSNASANPKEAVVLTQDGSRYMALAPLIEGEAAADVKKHAASYGCEVDSFAQAASAPAYSAYASQLKAAREQEEVQRLLYVALTRARDMLILVSCDKSFASKGELASGLFANVADALFAGGFPSSGGTFTLDTGCLVECIVQEVPYVAHGAAGDASSDADASADAMHEGLAEQQAAQPLAPRVHTLLADRQTPGLSHSAVRLEQPIASYSSIAQARKERANHVEVSSQGAGQVGRAIYGAECARALCGSEDLFERAQLAGSAAAEGKGAFGCAVMSSTDLPASQLLDPQAAEQQPVKSQTAEQQSAASWSDVAAATQQAASQNDASAAAKPYVALSSSEKKPETVSVVGSAFHLVAQWIACQDDPAALSVGDSALTARIAAAACRYALDEQQRARLDDAVIAWLGCPLFARICLYAHHLPEHAFLTQVDGVPVEGFIDLLCYDACGGRALVVDYKTGIGADDDELRKRYALQASVYAYALLSSGFAKEVELVFVHPEAALKEITYVYTAGDVSALASAICE